MLSATRKTDKIPNCMTTQHAVYIFCTGVYKQHCTVYHKAKYPATLSCKKCKFENNCDVFHSFSKLLQMPATKHKQTKTYAGLFLISLHTLSLLITGRQNYTRGTRECFPTVTQTCYVVHMLPPLVEILVAFPGENSKSGATQSLSLL